MTHDADVIIIGGGVSGLATAWHVAQRGRRALVLERAPRLGGALASVRAPSGYWYDLGAHTCYNTYGGLIDILERSGRADALLARDRVPYRILVDGELRSVVAELSLGRVLLSLPRMIGHSKRGKTVAQHYSRIVGRRNYERVLGPMLAAVPSQRADLIPAEMLFKRRPRRKDVAHQFTLEGGLGTVADVIAAHDGVDARTGVTVEGIADTGDGWAVTAAGGVELRAPKVALAVQPPVAAALIAGPRPDLCAALSQIATTTIDSCGYVFAKGDLDLEPVAFFAPRDEDIFWSTVTRDVVPDEGHRAFTFHFRQGLDPHARDARVGDVLGVDVTRAVHRAQIRSTLPTPRLGHHAIVAAIEAATPDDRLAVAGSFFAGLAIEDCVQRAIAVADQLLPTAAAGAR